MQAQQTVQNNEGKSQEFSPAAILIAGTVVAAAIAMFLREHPALAYLDAVTAQEIHAGGAELFHTQSNSILSPSANSIFWGNLSNFAFGAAAATIGFKLNSAKLIALAQLSIVSVILLALLPVGIEHPMEIWLTMALAVCVGTYARKQQDQLTRQQQLAYELRLRNQQLEQSEMLLVKTDETDKRIFAADLHDRVLNDIKMALKEFAEYKKAPDENKAKKITNLLNETMTDMRSLMDELNPVMLECFGLAAAIEDCANTFAQRGGFKVALDNSARADRVSRLNQVEQQLIYRLIQESLTNVYKHASAQHVSILIANDGEDLSIKISDDGKGMSSIANGSSRGIKYMRMRAALIGASVAWTPPESGSGTVVHINVPIRAHES